MIHSESASTSPSLLEQVRQRDESAWRQLSQIFAPSVYRWCRNKGLQPSDAADVVQEVFLAVSKNIDSFRRDRPGDSFRGWLWTISQSKISDHFRRVNARPPIDSQQDSPDQLWNIPTVNSGSGAVPLDHEATMLMRRALAIIEKDFSKKTWQAFWRSAVLGERTGEIAQSLNITAAAVCMCRSRVLLRLRETLAGLDILLPE